VILPPLIANAVESLMLAARDEFGFVREISVTPNLFARFVNRYPEGVRPKIRRRGWIEYQGQFGKLIITRHDS
jgi:hypothetical protein